MSESAPRRKLAAILATDVVNFSILMGENEDRTLKNLKACRILTDECITVNHGRIFGSAGDSIIAEFASPVDAVVAATEFQRSLKQRNEGVPEEDQMKFRVGLNLGDVIIEGELTIHGVKKKIKESGKIWNAKDKIMGECSFDIAVADYDIKIPRIVRENIAKIIKISVDVSLKRK